MKLTTGKMTFDSRHGFWPQIWKDKQIFQCECSHLKEFVLLAYKAKA